jgi:alpha-mannosidase
MELRKLRKLLLEVQEYPTVGRVPVDGWELKIGSYLGFDEREGASSSARQTPRYEWRGPVRTASPGLAWGGLEPAVDTGLFRKAITLPPAFKGFPVELQAVTGGEAQLFIDDKPFQGNDPNHCRVLLSEKARGDERFNVSIESWIRLSQSAIGEVRVDAASSGVFSQADLVAFDPDARSLVRDIRYALDLGETLAAGPHALHARAIEAVLSAIFAACDITDRAQFLAGVPAATARLVAVLEAIPRSADAVNVWMLGQSHLDIAWFWRTIETYRKSVRTFSTALHYMDLYPFYRFAMPQVKLYRMAGRAHPELMEQVRRRVREGRWEVSGMMYLESDTNVPRGEWLVRNLLLGRQVCGEVGQIPRVEALIDAFGYSGSLPQIFAKCGITSVVLTKMMWYNDTNKFPYSAFNWRGIDGSRVLVATMPWFNRPCDPGEVAANVERLQQKDVVRDVPVFYGWGDGGGGADDNHLENLARDLKWYRPDQVTAGRLDDFFDTLAKVQDRLPTWWGEVYQEGHRGCYTTQARHKFNNRASESLYRSLGWLMSLEQWQGGQAEQGRLAENIELIVTNQFHDTLSGSGATRIYEDGQRDYEKVLGEGRQWLAGTLEKLQSRIHTQGEGIPLVVWNLHGFSRPTMVETDWTGPKGGTLLDPAGAAVACAVADGKLRFVARDLPGFGYATYRFVPGPAVKTAAVVATGNRLESDRLLVEWNDKGQLTRVFHKPTGREALAGGGVGNRLVVYFDYPLNCDAWDLDKDYAGHGSELAARSIRVLPADAISRSVVFEYATDRSTIRQTMVLADGLDRVEFRTEVDWHEQHRLLKAHFAAAVQAPQATYDIPLGAIQRDTRPNTTWEQAKFEVPAISFADLSEPNFGLALTSPHKSGFAVHESDMSISLLRASTFPDAQADQGLHGFSYSLLAHSGDFAAGGTVQESRLLLDGPLACVAPVHAGPLPAKMSFMSPDRPSVILETLKAAEDGNGLILRVYESVGQHDRITIQLALPYREVTECNLLEEPLARTAGFTAKGGRLEFPITPFEIKTFRLKV